MNPKEQAVDILLQAYTDAFSVCMDYGARDLYLEIQDILRHAIQHLVDCNVRYRRWPTAVRED